MNRWTRFAAVAGIVMILFGVIGAFLVGDFTHGLMALHMIVGFVLLLIGLVSSGGAKPENISKAVTGRRAKFGYNFILYTAAFLVIVVGANYVGNERNVRWDFTEEGVFSLSSQTVQILNGLDKPLKIVAFTKNMGISEKENDKIKLYGDASKNVKVELVNPSLKPHLVDKYQMKQGNLVYIQYGSDESVIGDVRVDQPSEEAITNAIIKLTKGAAKKIYFVQGHDEPKLTDEGPAGIKLFADSLKDEHFSVDSIVLSKYEAVPSDAAAVLLVSPKKPLLQEEKDLLTKYVKSGGKLLLFNDPRTTSDIKELAGSFGVEVGEDVVIDRVQRLFAAPALGAQPVVSEYGFHDITKGLSADSVTIYNIASTVYPKPQGQKEDDATYTELVKTSRTSWAEKNITALFNEPPVAELDNDDISGPVTIAVSYEKTWYKQADQAQDPTTKEVEGVSRVVVFGDSDFLLNANLRIYSNRDLALNSVGWVAGEASAISIRPASFKLSLAPIPEATMILILSLSFLIPELILLGGLMVWWGRRTIVDA